MKLEANTAKEITLGAGEANIKAMIFVFPVLVIFALPYVLIWEGHILSSIRNIVFDNLLITLVVIVLGAIVHELIHGLFWSFFQKNGFKSIKFGIVWKYLTPYCHCSEPLLLRHYRLGALMPGIIMGVIPSLISLLTGNAELFIFGCFFTLAAGGDLLMILLLRKESKKALVQDHPDKIGCTILN